MSSPAAIASDDHKHGVNHTTDHVLQDGLESEHEAHEPHEPRAAPSSIKPIEHEDDLLSSSGLSRHPIPSMQEAFEESIMDSADTGVRRKSLTLDVQARRQQLLDDHDDLDKGYSTRWRQTADAKFHPLWKVVAQISFGIHLLHKGLAKSEDEVVKILQRHIDEVDSFAEETMDDFELAIKDIGERIDCLEIALQHSREFNRMLCDKAFRMSILENNDVIERIMYRTRKAMETSLLDVSKGQDAVIELNRYLERLGTEWPGQAPELISAYETMKGNAEGWYRCFQVLHEKGEQLTNGMVHLQATVDDIARRAGIASRRNTPTGLVGRKSYQSSRQSTDLPASMRNSAILEKPLPAIPPVQLPQSEQRASRSLHAPAGRQQTIKQPSSLPAHARQDSVLSSPRLSAVTVLKVDTTQTRIAVNNELHRISIPARQPRPSTPPRSSRRPSAMPITDGGNLIDSAYASCPETPTFLPPKRSTDSTASPASSIASTPKTSISQPRPFDPAGVALARPQPRYIHDENSRRPSLTALPIFSQTSDKPSPSHLVPIPLNVKKNRLGGTVKNFLERKRQSLAGNMPGGFL